MSSYESFCASGFGRALASQARDENARARKLPRELAVRAERAWNVTASAHAAIRREANRLLSTEPSGPIEL